MKLALLGSDELTAGLAESVSRGGHQIVAVYRASGDLDALRKLTPGAVWSDNWETLLHEAVAEAVVVAADVHESARDDQLRKLVQASIPLLIVQPACESIVGFELDMIRRDTNCPMVPFSPGRWHAAIERLATLAATGETSPIGSVEQLVFERTMSDRRRDRVLFQFARDVCLIRGVVGEINKISAMGDAGEEQISNLTVNMSCPNGTLARWSAGFAGDSHGGSLLLIGSKGRATLNMPTQSNWSLDITGSQQEQLEFAESDELDIALRRLEAAIAGGQPEPLWLDACRDVELADTIQHSLRRGRTIELFNEEPSEESSFKGIMAVGSCALLLLTLLVMFVGSVVEGVRLQFRRDELHAAQKKGEVRSANANSDDLTAKNPRRTHLLIRLWPVYPFAIFLLLQSLKLVFRSKPELASTGTD